MPDGLALAPRLRVVEGLEVVARTGKVLAVWKLSKELDDFNKVMAGV